MAGNDDEVAVRIHGDTEEGTAAINEFAEHFEKVFDALMNGSVKDLLEAVMELPAFITVAVGVVTELGETVKELVAESAKMNDAAISLGERLGIASSDAQALDAALKEVGVSSDTYAGAAQRLLIQVKANEDALNAMGLATRDSNGELRSTGELMDSAIELLGSYREGTDRNTAALYMFGRGAGDAAQLMRLHSGAVEETKEKLQALGMTITTESVEAFKKYRAAQDDAGDVTEAITYMLGQEFMPVFTEVLQTIGEYGPEVVGSLKVAINALEIAFETLMYPLKMVYYTLDLTFQTIANTGARAIAVIVAAIHGDWVGAWELVKSIPQDTIGGIKEWGDSAQASFDRTTASIEKSVDAIRHWKDLQGTPAGKEGPQGTKSFETPETGSQLKNMQGELTELLYQQQAYGEKAKEIEASYWRQKLGEAQVGSDDYKAILEKVYALENEGAEQARQNALRTDEETLKSREAMAEEAADHKEKMAAVAARNYEITKAQELQIDIEAEQEKYQAELEALQRQMQLQDLDLAHRLEIQNRINLLTEKFNDRQAEMAEQLAHQQSNTFTNLGHHLSATLSNAFNQMASGTRRFFMILRGIWNSIVSDFISMTTKMVVEHALGERMKTALTEEGELERIGLKLWGSIQSLAISAAQAIKEIAIYAYTAMAGAYSAIASIPYIGPFLAPAMAIAAGAAVFAIGASIASASGGWMVPDDTLAMVHKDERILPARYSAGLDAMVLNAGQGGDGNGGTTNNLHYHAGPNETPRSIFANQKAFEAMAKRAHRNFSSSGKR